MSFEEHKDRLEYFEQEGYFDGRTFRTHYKYGGYKCMCELHGLERTLKGRSDEFKKEIEVLTYPESIFDV